MIYEIDSPLRISYQLRVTLFVRRLSDKHRNALTVSVDRSWKNARASYQHERHLESAHRTSTQHEIKWFWDPMWLLI